jgi:hypothetical protein
VDRFIDHLYTPLGTTSNYSAIADLYTLQITTAPAKSSPVCGFSNSHSLATACNGGDSSASSAQVLLSQPPVMNSCQLSTLAPSLLSLHCRAQMNRQPSTELVRVRVRVRVRVMLRPTISRLVCLGIKHPSGAYDQIFITVRHLRVCWCGALSLTRGRVCRL